MIFLKYNEYKNEIMKQISNTIKKRKLSCVAINNPAVSSTNAIIIPDNMDNFPEANGLNRFRGCDLSEFRSNRSFITQLEDAAKLNAKKAPVACSVKLNEENE